MLPVWEETLRARQTILRRIMDLPDLSAESILSLGIDDFSLRRGCRVGTILVNLESRRVVALFPDRKAQTSAAWMRQHPDLMAVSRDRGGDYASAAEAFAPQAIACADRFHLLTNLGEAFEDLLARHLCAARKHQVEGALEEQAPAWRATREARRSQKPREALSVHQRDRLARYQQMLALREQGMTQAARAQQIGVCLATVPRWVAAGTFPDSRRGRYVSRLDPCLPSLILGWEQGCHTMAWRYRALVAKGYQGSSASVRDNLVRRLPFGGRKTSASSSSKVLALATPRQAAFLFLRHPEKLSISEQETLGKLCQVHPEVDQA